MSWQIYDRYLQCQEKSQSQVIILCCFVTHIMSHWAIWSIVTIRMLISAALNYWVVTLLELPSPLLMKTFRHTYSICTSHCEVTPTTSINILCCSPLVPSMCFRFVGRRLASASQPADPGSSCCDETFPSRAVGLGQSAREESGRLFHNISWLPHRGCFLMQSD